MLLAILFFGLFESEHKVKPQPSNMPDKILYRGHFEQGGLVEIQAPAGTIIDVDGKEYEGFGNHYVIGFGRDNPGLSNLKITYPDGKTETQQVAIKQHEFKTQFINNVDPSIISHPTEANTRVIDKEAFELGMARHMASFDCPASFSFIRPAPGRITALFGSSRVYNGVGGKPHSGVDFAGAVGDPAISPEAGKIIYVEDMLLTGKTMAIDHGCGVVSTFMHLSKAEKQVGDIVQKGEVVARIGRTGIVTGPHLHWSLNLGSIRLDPLLVLQ